MTKIIYNICILRNILILIFVVFSSKYNFFMFYKNEKIVQEMH